MKSAANLTTKSQTTAKAQEHAVLAILRSEFSARAEKNPQFSLRSFARFLGISHSLLSLVLNGQRKPSKKFVAQIVERLPLSPDQQKTLMAAAGPSGAKKRISKDQKFEYYRLSLDQFALMSEWQHYAILSLLEIPDTQLTPEFIAQRLNISVMLARVCLQRLFNLNLIEKDPKTDRWKQSAAPIVVENTKSTAHSRKFQKRLMLKAIESLENDPMEVRDISSTTFAMDAKHVGYALKRIREFRRELTRELEEFGAPNEVYNLSVQLFPTSTRRKK